MSTSARRCTSLGVLTACLVIAACSSGDEPAAERADTSPSSATDPPAATSVTEAPTTVSPTTEAPTATIDPNEARTIEQVNEYITQAAAFDQVGADAQFPAGLTFAAGGAPGYTRYVFHEHSEGVVPTLVEGPLDDPVRCQEEALPCSYLELRELAASGAPIPAELEMDAAQLTELVAQLDAVNAFAEAHRDVNSACAEGFVSDQIQTANMGSHFYQPQWLNDGFEPSRPEILLYALASGEAAAGPVGQCMDGVWVGEPMQLVGISFLIPPAIIGSSHPETFAGPLDNWHIHYNLCRGRTSGRDTFVPRSECEAAGGSFAATLGWMIHAWVDPAHDNPLGVFSMWNSTIAPVSDAATILENREVRGSDFPEGAQQSLITDFRYGTDLRVTVGQPLFFNNVDAVPHTVTAGTPAEPALDDFDSGLLTPGQNFALTFDDPGVYSLFCTLHTDMVATVDVTE